MKLANDYVFEYRTNYIQTYIKKIHETKFKQELDFKRDVDRLVYQSTETKLKAMGCPDNFARRL
jgi:hypothetical protein